MDYLFNTVFNNAKKVDFGSHWDMDAEENKASVSPDGLKFLALGLPDGMVVLTQITNSHFITDNTYEVEVLAPQTRFSWLTSRKGSISREMVEKILLDYSVNFYFNEGEKHGNS